MIIPGWVCVSLGFLVKRHLSNTLISLKEAKKFLKDAWSALLPTCICDDTGAGSLPDMCSGH